MKKLLPLLLFLFTALSGALAQNFEGKIMYRNTFKSNLPNVTDEQWSTMLGDKMEYSIKGASYHSVSNGALLQWQLYHPTENKLYTKLANSETVLWHDGAVNEDEVLQAELKKGAAEILGYTCDELTLTCKSGIQVYYFHQSLGVDPGLFTKHKFGNFYDYIAKAKALPLKTIVENAQFKLVSTAEAVNPMVLDKALFSLPAGVKTEKSPY